MNKDRKIKIESKLKEIIWSKMYELTMEIQQDFWLITLNELILAPDMSYIDVFVSSLKQKDILCKTLAKYAQELKHHINNTMPLRKTPIIRFRYDDSMEHSNSIISKINDLNIE